MDYITHVNPRHEWLLLINHEARLSTHYDRHADGAVKALGQSYYPPNESWVEQNIVEGVWKKIAEVDALLLFPELRKNIWPKPDQSVMIAVQIENTYGDHW